MNATFERDHVAAERWTEQAVPSHRVITPKFETVSNRDL